MVSPLVLAYYCSGHGYGHATRVSAFTRHLLSLPDPVHVHIVSSAPALVFADSIALGAYYRYAEIDPVIVQPLAYRVDREKSVHVLQHFLDKKDALVKQESSWLTSINARAVLSDAAFLACLAASASSIPSVLLTNFTFDSVYSFLSTPLLDIPPQTSATLRHIPSLHHLPPSAPPSPAHLGLDNHHHHHSQHPPPLALPPPLNPHEEDAPIPLELLHPLTQQLLNGYTHADLLVLLPGAIPIPSFPFPLDVNPKLSYHISLPQISPNFDDSTVMAPILPSSEWVDPNTRRTFGDVGKWMKAVASLPPLGMTDLFVATSNTNDVDSGERKRQKRRRRQVIHAPLIVRPPSSGAPSSLPSSSIDHQSPSPVLGQKQSPYTPEGRSALLKSIGVPVHLHDHKTTRILVVSFGGQVFRCLPGSHHSSHGSHGSPRRGHGSRSPSRTRNHSSSRRASREISNDVGVDVKAVFAEGSQSSNELGDTKLNRTQNDKGKQIKNNVLKPLDPNSIGFESPSATANRVTRHHVNANGNANRSSVPGINNTDSHSANGDNIGVGASVSSLQKGKMLSSPSPSKHSRLSPSPSSSPSLSPCPSPRCCPSPPQRIATPCHIWIPGAPAPVPLAPLPLPPSLVETATATTRVRRRRTIAVAAIGRSSSTTTTTMTTTTGAERLVRMTSERMGRGMGVRRGWKRSASVSASMTMSVSVSTSAPLGSRPDVPIPSVVTIPPTPLPVDYPRFPTGWETETNKDLLEEKGKEMKKCGHDVHEREREGKVDETLARKENEERAIEMEKVESAEAELKEEEEKKYTFIHEEDHTIDSVEEYYHEEYDYDYDYESGLVPDDSWIAIVCGMSGSSGSSAKNGNRKKKKAGAGEGREREEVKGDEEEEDFLPEGFYVAPRDVYMPDLMAVADVLLGKLGYGTVSECVDACTPFIYVSRPLFIEEHGLRLLLDQQGVGVELSREAYEKGEWARAVSEAWERGREAKEEKRRREEVGFDERRRNGGGEEGGGGDRRQEEGRQLAGKVVDWVRVWWGDEME